MAAIPSRELRNHTADVLRQVADGTPVTITVNGTPVAEITSYRSGRRLSMSRHELTELLTQHQTDSGLRQDLAELAGDDTDSLGPLS